MILNQAKEKYPFLFDLGLQDEGIEARYYLYEYLFQEFQYTGILGKDIHGKPLPISINGQYIYWSISHTVNYVSYIASDTPTGIDITEYFERDSVLLDIHTPGEYDLLSGKSWQNFYILWTAKEAIIKLLGGILDDMENIKLIKREEVGISFFEFLGQKHRIKTIIDDSVIISYIS